MAKIEVGPAAAADIAALAQIYVPLCEDPAGQKRHPGWARDKYPARETAQAAFSDGTLFVARCQGRVAGGVILRRGPEPDYAGADWHSSCPDSKTVIVHTLTVALEFQGCGIGRRLMDFAAEYAVHAGCDELRLDVYAENLPAIRLYESCGFCYVTTLDLGYGGQAGYRLYKKRL